MKTLLCFIVIVFVQLRTFGQCSPSPSEACEDAEVLCSINDLNGYQCFNYNYSNPTGCTPLCPSGGTTNNTQWWAFVTGGGQVCISFSVSNCYVTNQGIHFGIWGDCSCSESITCDPNCFNAGSRQLCALLSACETYYLFVDGCGGDVCNYTINTTGAELKPLIISKLNGPTDVCVGMKDVYYNFEVDPNYCISNNIWTLDGVELNQYERGITLDFLEPGDHVLCAKTIVGNLNKTCIQSNSKCINIKVSENEVKTGAPIQLCSFQLPYIWGSNLIYFSGIYQSTYKIGLCNVDSLREFIVLQDDEYPCNLPSTITGLVYYDLNKNGSFNKNIDVLADGVLIDNDQIDGIFFTDNGKYEMKVLPNVINIIKPYIPAGTRNSFKPNQYSVLLSPPPGQVKVGYDFAIDLQDSIDLEAILSVSRSRAGSPVLATISVNNLGANNIQNAGLNLKYPEDWKFLNANLAGSNQNGNVQWNFNSGIIGTSVKFNAWFKIPGDAPANKRFQLKAIVQTALDKRTINNESTFNDFIRNSYDPNDKLVQVIRDPNSDSPIGDLLYTVRFQNTGNDTAYNIRIRDSISHLLDPKSVRIVNSSHPCRIEMKILGVIDFYFHNINLLDSFHHEDQSHGFVQFLIKPKTNVRVNDIIGNRAAIYFDLNPPVITNEVKTSFLTIQNNAQIDLAFDILPNPFKNSFEIHYSPYNYSEGLTAILLSVEGSQIMQFDLDNSGYKIINAESLSNGLYYLKIQNKKQLLGVKKFVKL